MANTKVSMYELADIKLAPVSKDSLRSSSNIDVIFIDPSGRQRQVPTFTSNNDIRVRYSSALVGIHSYHVLNQEGLALNNPTGTVEVTPNKFSHGPVHVSNNARHLEHADGTPFLWLADTWWHGFVARLSNEEFETLAKKRAEQGFSVIQIVAGLYPEMEPFSPEGNSRSGWPWFDHFTAPNIAWFDEADSRINILLKNNLTPCIVGSWFQYLDHMDTESLLRHWRELIARWGALSVVWCLVGEAPVPTSKRKNGFRSILEKYVLSVPNNKQSEPSGNALSNQMTLEGYREQIFSEYDTTVNSRLQKLNDVAREVRQTDPFDRLITIHSDPNVNPWFSLEDEDLVDFWLPQTAHGPNALENAVTGIQEALSHSPRKPAINGEPAYEGISGTHWHDTQRFMFWSNVLSGAAGHTYGAHGVWGFNTADYPGFHSGRAAHWKYASEYRGASHVGIGRTILLNLPWYRFQPHPEWIESYSDDDSPFRPYAAGIADEVRLVYLPSQALYLSPHTRLKELGTKPWVLQLINPRTGKNELTFSIEPSTDGTSTVLPRSATEALCLPSWEDWLVLMRPSGVDA